MCLKFTICDSKALGVFERKGNRGTKKSKPRP
jgi:hypothetical protein